MSVFVWKCVFTLSEEYLLQIYYYRRIKKINDYFLEFILIIVIRKPVLNKFPKSQAEKNNLIFLMTTINYKLCRNLQYKDFKLLWSPRVNLTKAHIPRSYQKFIFVKQLITYPALINQIISITFLQGRMSLWERFVHSRWKWKSSDRRRMSSVDVPRRC